MKQPQRATASVHLENSAPEYEAYSGHLEGPMTDITEQHFPLYHTTLAREHFKVDLKFESKLLPSCGRRFITLVTNQEEIWGSQRKTTAKGGKGTVTIDTKDISLRYQISSL